MLWHFLVALVVVIIIGINQHNVVSSLVLVVTTLTEYAVSLESDIKDKTDDPEQALLLILLKVRLH